MSRTCKDFKLAGVMKSIRLYSEACGVFVAHPKLLIAF